MAKGKNLNPADAYRKALRKKELKKNKAERSKARDLALVKSDTSGIESEITTLQAKAQRSEKESQRLQELHTELERINKKKEEYVSEHPEHRKLVYQVHNRHRDDEDNDKNTIEPNKRQRNYFNKDGTPRHPERSIYYDPVFNPYGAPPPGMPYLERPPLPGEAYSDEEIETVSEPSEDDIALPDDPHPGNDTTKGSWDDDEDDILLPEGTPPPSPGTSAPLPKEGPPLPPPMTHFYPPFPSILHAPALPTMTLPYSQGYYHAPLPESHPRHGRKSGGSTTTAFSLSSGLAGSTLPTTEAETAVGVISAEAELRDFKKESTVFMPASLKRNLKNRSSGPRVNAKPAVEKDGSEGQGTAEGEDKAERPDLLKTLERVIGPRMV